jgi:hypothetical protein
MSTDTLELDRDLGQATIVYEDPDDGTVERTVENEQIAYFQDHWLLKAGEDAEGNDVVRRVPDHKVYYVERSVEEFEEEIKTLRNQVQSFADDVRRKLPIGGGDDRQGDDRGVGDDRHGDGDENGRERL